VTPNQTNVKLNASIQLPLPLVKLMHRVVPLEFAVTLFSKQSIQHVIPTNASMNLLLFAPLKFVMVTLSKEQIVIGLIALHTLLRNQNLKSISYHWIPPKVMV